MQNRYSIRPLFAWAAFALLTLAAYWPGLHGGFLFDDFANLPALGATGPIDTWPTFWRYITSGTADPTGRPLTLLTFLLDANDWPANPFPFKRTSLILHLFNGALLYVLLAKLGQSLVVETRRYQTAALFGAALWLLHPLLVSTTLYIVQREAMLPATCVMAGLLIWLHGRNQLFRGNIRGGLIWSVIGLGGFTLLGILAKANGALLPFYALLIEVIVLKPRHALPSGQAILAHRGVMWILGVVPAATILAYLTRIAVLGMLHGDNMGIRPWSTAQRLLTEPRILLDYLSLLWVPRAFSSGLFNDQYVASTSLLHPATTLPAIIAILIMIGVAWRLRKHYPAWSLAILFYFAGQLLESTSIGLELYFEHRNYVPALLMFWPLGLWLADTRTLSLLKRGLMIVLPLGLAVMTHASTEVWGNVHAQALVWADINPNSARAQTNAAQNQMQTGHPFDAARRLENLLIAQPDQVQLAFSLIGAHCMTGGITSGDIAAARTAMRGSANTGSLFANWFDRTLPVAATGECPGLTLAVLLDLINDGLHNPKLADSGRQQDFLYMRGRIALAQHQPDEALADYLRALDLQIRPGFALEVAAILGSAGYPTQGLQLLDHYQQVKSHAMPPDFGMPMVHEWVLTRQDYWPHELTHLRATLSEQAEEHTTPDGQSPVDIPHRSDNTPRH
ncbi:tetratricopeptide repeat protein [Rhodanobacter glycinis]|uniref:tetratricopeptide repeat protein n=1 Tax=Rhodanobacter glycinis TaxID=582702 RepID=UPI001128211A|nr:tetratricopeptide repeat protein [Rhodanobacter glycinis]TPG47848.1 tetratricopeptide repeat protein [Rhodanobacter glycinis]